ncbi:hypothetical protein [Actinoplanes sp. NBRC 103695]|uniref:hypothetical protein n=1 Tax=Actinoplanes sp. NBRC 103695 TaxID=3032202 RepID=UPI0024A4C996|nr:hypothetical protein [Actinoplanes sp. NBRC 103695]GLY93446.1 peptidoglycan-binding protein [Actinoplanes sp. NBRC 103695]
MHPEQPQPRRIGRRIVIPALVIVIVAAAVVVWYQRRDTSKPSAGTPVAVRTVAVEKTDLSVTKSLTGTLGYGRARPVKGGRDGIVTWLPRSGASISRGRQLFRADDRPVPLFYGAMPLYRDLETPKTVGRDVRIVATNLKALGYSIGRQPDPGETVTRTIPLPAPEPSATPGAPTPPDHRTERTTVRKGEGVLTSGLIAALKRWQRDLGLPVTGTIGVGDVVVLPGAVRVDSVTALTGDSATTPLITVTSTTKVVTASATVAEAGGIKAGDEVTVLLPGDASVPGEVSAVGTEVQQGEEGSGNAEPKRAVTVTLDSGKGLNGIEQAQVQVDLAGETREGVLVVPVGALVALSEGGYAVQLADDRLVAVETGLFAKGLVEVTGDGITEGAQVVTTS